MALHAYAALTANGVALGGDVTINSIGGVDVSSDHIELYAVSWGARVGAEGQSARAQRQSLPIRLVKRVDQTTPEFYQALAQNQTIAGHIKLFETDPVDGSTRHRFTVTITGARVLGIESQSPDTLDAAGSHRPACDVIELAPQMTTYTDVVYAKEHTDKWGKTL